MKPNPNNMTKAKRTTHEFREKERLRSKAKYDRLRAEGTCTRCCKGKPEAGKTNCEDCLAVYRIAQRQSLGPAQRARKGSFLHSLSKLSGLTVRQISTATGLPQATIYEWRTRKPNKDETLRLKTYLIGQ
jgi:hypothetical protein